MDKKAKIDKLKFWSSSVEYIKFNITTYWKKIANLKFWSSGVEYINLI